MDPKEAVEVQNVLRKLADTVSRKKRFRLQLELAERENAALRAKLAAVVEALGAVTCPFCDEVFMVTVPDARAEAGGGDHE